MSHVVDTDATGVRAKRPTRVLAGGLTMVMVALAAACAPPAEPTAPYGLRASLGDAEIVLEWTAPDGMDVAGGYELQWGTPTSPWTDLTATAATTATVTDVESLTSYNFRVRAAASGTMPAGPWSQPVQTLYVDPVLPTIRIDTAGRVPVLDKETDIDATMAIDPNGSGYDAYSGAIEIRGRGNSTWDFPKKPYRIELDEDASLMGMPVHEDFVLLANAVDRSQLRTWAAAQAGEVTDLPYTPRYRHVELILNGRYIGVYQLTEDADKIDPGRIDITEIEEEDVSGEPLTGGYLLEIDGRLEANGEPGFRTARGVPVVIKEPDPAAREQRDYIRAHVQAFENALFSPTFDDPVEGYRAFLDVDSFIDYYLVQELTRNEDSFWSSTFFTKDRGDDQFRFGPLWDFDLSLGLSLDGSPRPPEGFQTRDRMPWTIRIFEDATFREQLAERWAELKPEFEQIAAQLVPLGTTLRPAIEHDEAVWGVVPGPTNDPEFVSSFLSERIAWLNERFDAVVDGS